MTPDKAFILAAGFGTRLRPHTNDKPKPMVKVHGKPMIDHALDQLESANVKTCIVNTHYKADILHDHLKDRTSPEIIISHEPDILDTGGGIKNAIHHFTEPFYVVSGDSVCEDDPDQNALKAMAEMWDSNTMDILLLLQPVNTMALTHGVGDYDLDDQGRAVRSLDKDGKYMWTSIRINHPAIFENTPDQPFSYLQLLDKAQENGRLYGMVHKGTWHHISTPDDLKAVNEST